jgi:hypothetical protein
MDDVKEQFDTNNMKNCEESFVSNVQYNEDIEIKIITDIDSHDDNCDNFPFVVNDNCGCPKVREITFYINIRYKCINVLQFPMKETTLNKMLKKIKKDFPDSMFICHCGEKAIEELNKCRQCFIHSYIRTEEEGGDCPICFENDWVWIKTKCNHIFHQSCLKKAKAVNGLCPICRAIIDYHICYPHSHGVNPYNV